MTTIGIVRAGWGLNWRGQFIPICTFNVTHIRYKTMATEGREYIKATLEKERSDKGSYRHFFFLISGLNDTWKCTPATKVLSTPDATYLYIHLRPVSDRRAVARRVSRRRGNTGRQRQVVLWWCSTTSQRLGLGDLSETELTAGLWESKRYVDTCAQSRDVRPVRSTSTCTVCAVPLYIQYLQ